MMPMGSSQNVEITEKEYESALKYIYFSIVNAYEIEGE